jgi:hypothetical protein
MEDLSVSRVFGVPEDYTLEQLKQSYLNLMENLFKSNKTQVEKDLLASQYKKLYYYGKQMYLERVSVETDDEYPNNYSKSNELDLFDKFAGFSGFGGFSEFGKFDKMFDNSIDFGHRIRRTYNPFSIFDNVLGEIGTDINSSQNGKSQVYSYSSSYSSNTNPDGSRTIIEHKNETTNGDNKKTINAYKKMPDGSVVNLSEDEMKQLEKLSNLRIENN